jgi:hypothetical protein
VDPIVIPDAPEVVTTLVSIVTSDTSELEALPS